MREKFEKLPEIAEELLMENKARFDSSKNMYIHGNEDYQINLNFINGAWYAYQEQQKKIDEALNLVRDARQCAEPCDIWNILNEIERILK